ncbi:unnamed protein product [Aphanomyces euteiches]|nr:hypothetical protein AeRB84_007005 [Aphanomyces euteiches]
MRYERRQLVVALDSCATAQTAYSNGLAVCNYIPQKSCGDSSCLHNNQIWCNATICSSVLAISKNTSASCQLTPAIPQQLCNSQCLATMLQLEQLYTTCSKKPPTLDSCTACQSIMTSETHLSNTCGLVNSTAAMRVSLAAAISICQANFPQILMAPTTTTDANPQLIAIILVVGLIVIISVLSLVFMQYRKYRQARRRSSILRSSLQRRRTSILSFESQDPYILKSPSDYDVELTSPKYSIIEDVRFDKKFTQFRIPVEDFKQKTHLKSGGHALLFRALWKERDVAIKQIAPSHAKDFHALQEFMREIRLSAYLRHEHIVEFLGISWLTLKDISIVTEYMVHGDVSSVLRSQRQAANPWLHWYAPPTKPEVVQTIQLGFQHRLSPCKLSIALHVIRALVYLHANHVVHRDIKSKNVVLDTMYTAKLCDFGISRRISAVMTANRGTVSYMAPEVFQGNKYSEMADIYSFGVFLSEMDKLDSPYVGEKDDDMDADVSFPEAKIALMVTAGTLKPTFTDAMPREILDLAQRCLEFDATLRPTAVQLEKDIESLIKSHPSE